METVKIERTTKETSVYAEISFPGKGDVSVNTTVPFFDHMLTALFFHGGFDAKIKAKGDTEIDDHHLVEDTGIVIGQCLAQAAASVLTDFCGRPFLVWNVHFPQIYCGRFEMCLLKEFFSALVSHARINLHINGLYGENSHHLSEAVFKAVGKAVGQSLTKRTDGVTPSSKGMLES